MLQIGTKNVFLYLPEDEPGIEKLGGEYEQKLKRWRFSMDKKEVARQFVEDRYPDLFDSDFDKSDDAENDESDIEIDQRLHRAQSFSGYDSDERSSDDEDDSSDDDGKTRSRSRSNKFKEGYDRYRPKLSNKQFSKRRNSIKNRAENGTESADAIP